MARTTYSQEWNNARKKMVSAIDKLCNVKVASLVDSAAIEWCYDYQNVINRKHLPFYTGNLKESTGVAYYKNGTLVTANLMPSQAASKPQNYRDRKKIVGLAEAYKMVRSLAYEYPVGRIVSVYSAVPYASDVNKGLLGTHKRNKGYFDRLTRTVDKDLTKFIKRRLKAK